MSDELCLGDRVRWEQGKGGAIMHDRRYYSLAEPPELPGLKDPVYFLDYAPGMYPPGEIAETAVSKRRDIRPEEAKHLARACAKFFMIADKLVKAVFKGSEEW